MDLKIVRKRASPEMAEMRKSLLSGRFYGALLANEVELSDAEIFVAADVPRKFRHLGAEAQRRHPGIVTRPRHGVGSKNAEVGGGSISGTPCGDFSEAMKARGFAARGDGARGRE